jgi:hypothetical protein
MRPSVLSLVLPALVAGSVSAASGLTGVNDAIKQTARDLLGILPPLSMLLVILGAIFYAAGKLVPNPEFSGRASGLAAAAIAAAIISLVIYMVLPCILQTIFPQGNFDISIGNFGTPAGACG